MYTTLGMRMRMRMCTYVYVCVYICVCVCVCMCMLSFGYLSFKLASNKYSKQSKGTPTYHSKINGITLLTLCVTNDCENTIMMTQCRQKLM